MAEQAAVVFFAVDSAVSLDSTGFDFGGLVAPFALYANGHTIGRAAIEQPIESGTSDGCKSWPLVQLGLVADSGGRVWVVGVEEGRVIPFAADSLSGMGRADSARLTIELSRLASGAPFDTAAALRGTPFQVRRAYRLTTARGTSLVLAEVIRVLNQEANPLHEHLLIVARPDSATGRLVLAYSERASGPEESLESTELLLAGQTTSDSTSFALLARYIGDGVIYSLLEAPRGGRWRVRWTSSYSGC